MRVGVYAISLNEEKFAERWANCAADADYVFVADTGSTDSTVPILLGTKHVQVGQIAVKPWRFDDARNTALNLMPSNLDVVIALDMDEVLVPGWRKIIEDNWNGCTRLRYRYVWSWYHDVPDVVYHAEKIHGRFTHRWKHPVHEILKPTVPEVSHFINDILIEHRADDEKSRGQYLGLLELAVQEDPHDDRNAHYLGREYHSFGRYNDAIKELYRHLDLPSAQWLAERARSMRYIAKSYESLGDLEEANRWFQMAILEDPHSREALVDVAQFALARNEFHQTIHYCEKALTLPSTGGFYLNERYALQEGPYELASVAYFYLKDRIKAIELCKKALALNPHSTLSQTNLKMMVKT